MMPIRERTPRTTEPGDDDPEDHQPTHDIRVPDGVLELPPPGRQ